MNLSMSKEPKKVVVIGGGIGGMASARALALCGHEVVIIEKNKELGGQLNLACIPPHKQEISKWVIYLRNELERLSVQIKNDTLATKEIIDSYGPNIVVVATGAKEIIPNIKGVDKEKAITAQRLLKNEEIILGGNILIVGGGMVGCEVCEHLMHNKRGPMQITMIEMLEAIGAGMVPNNLIPMMNRLQGLGIEMMTSTRLVSVNGRDVDVQCRENNITMHGYTHIVYACGSKAENKLYEEIKDKYENVICIGDANGPRQALEAVREGFEVAIKNM